MGKEVLATEIAEITKSGYRRTEGGATERQNGERDFYRIYRIVSQIFEVILFILFILSQFRGALADRVMSPIPIPTAASWRSNRTESTRFISRIAGLSNKALKSRLFQCRRFCVKRVIASGFTVRSPMNRLTCMSLKQVAKQITGYPQRN